MKKIILSMVFVLGMITIGNANTNIVKDFDYVDCDEFATVTQWIAINAGYSFEESLGVFGAAYDACIDYNIENLMEFEEE